MHRLLCLAALLCLSQAEELSVMNVDPRDADPSSATRIFGPEAAPIEQYPYTVQVLLLRRFICSGILLTRHHVLTAAHCFINPQGAEIHGGHFSVRAGAQTIFNATVSQIGQVRDVNRVVVHPNFNVTNYDSDLAVLLLNSPLNLNNQVRTAVLSSGDSLPYETFLVSVGWGETRGITVDVLLDALLQKVNTTACAEMFDLRPTLPGEVTSNTMCAARSPGFQGFNPCVADSGSPLIFKYNLTLHMVVGMTSWAPSPWECSNTGYTTVNVRLANFVDWINGTVSTELAVSSAPTMSLTNSMVLMASLLASLIVFKNN